MKKLVLISILAFFSSLALGQISWQLAQYQLEPFLLNPAAAGLQQCHSVALGFRRQYSTLDRPIQTSLASYTFSTEESGLKRYKSGWHGFGATLVEDRVGDFTAFTISGAYAYHLRLSGDRLLSVGTALSVNRLVFQSGRVNTQVPNDPAFGDTRPIYLFPLFTPGIVYSTETWYAGLSVWNMFKANMSGFGGQIGTPADLERMIYLSTMKTFTPDDYNQYHVGGQVRYNGALLPSVDVQAGWTFDNNFTAMTGYRIGDAVMGIIQFRFLAKFKLGYAYEYNLSSLSSIGQHTHEIMLTINSCASSKAFDPRRYCPAYAKAH